MLPHKNGVMRELEEAAQIDQELAKSFSAAHRPSQAVRGFDVESLASFFYRSRTNRKMRSAWLQMTHTICTQHAFGSKFGLFAEKIMKKADMDKELTLIKSILGPTNAKLILNYLS
ncbi:MAG: hypothetical protein H0X51_08590 [Parachlamydiaceae bacterium]|nr:hypothetical protein [Parachlamydiaceae bacterium]